MRGVKQLIGVLEPRADTTNRRHNLLIHSKHIKMESMLKSHCFWTLRIGGEVFVAGNRAVGLVTRTFVCRRIQ